MLWNIIRSHYWQIYYDGRCHKAYTKVCFLSLSLSLSLSLTCTHTHAHTCNADAFTRTGIQWITCLQCHESNPPAPETSWPHPLKNPFPPRHCNWRLSRKTLERMILMSAFDNNKKWHCSSIYTVHYCTLFLFLSQMAGCMIVLVCYCFHSKWWVLDKH